MNIYVAQRRRGYLRVFNVLNGFLLFEDPAQGRLEAVGHAPKDNLRHLQSGTTQTHYIELFSTQTLPKVT